jgi:hypothetical protein
VLTRRPLPEPSLAQPDPAAPIRGHASRAEHDKWGEWWGEYRYPRPMAAARRSRRQRGEIERLSNGSYRVRVYVGTAPLSGKRH